MDMRKLALRTMLKVRLASGLTQEQLAEKSGHSQQYISGLERGARNPTVVSLFELADAGRFDRAGSKPVISMTFSLRACEVDAQGSE